MLKQVSDSVTHADAATARTPDAAANPPDRLGGIIYARHRETMIPDEQSFTIFIASPQDVARERDHVAREARRKAGEYERELAVRVVAWEETDWDSMTHIQRQIEDPALADLVIVILGGRLGSPLDRHGARFVGEISGWVAPPGTVWEYERAAAARAVNGAWPRVHVFIRSAPASSSLEYADLAEIQREPGRRRRLRRPLGARTQAVPRRGLLPAGGAERHRRHARSPVQRVGPYATPGLRQHSFPRTRGVRARARRSAVRPNPTRRSPCEIFARRASRHRRAGCS